MSASSRSLPATPSRWGKRPAGAEWWDQSLGHAPDLHLSLLQQLAQEARHIYREFLSSQALSPVNIDRQAWLGEEVLAEPRPDMFREQQLQVSVPRGLGLGLGGVALEERTRGGTRSRGKARLSGVGWGWSGLRRGANLDLDARTKVKCRGRARVRGRYQRLRWSRV